MASSRVSEGLESDNPVRISLLSMPRSLSTVFMKCLAAIEGIDVHMEIYNYAVLAAKFYEMETGQHLPAVLNGNEAAYEKAAKLFEENIRITVSPNKLSFASFKEELERSTSKYVLIKEQAFLLDSCLPYLPAGFKHTFLIRDPSRVYASFRRGFVSKFGPILCPSEPESVDIIKDDMILVTPLEWFEKQHKLWKYVKENVDSNPVCIDAFDLVSRPGPTLMAYCQAVGLPYSDELLQWKAWEKFPDNVNTAGPQFLEQHADFYAVALQSTHFMAPKEPGPIPRDQLTDDVIRCVDHAMPFYREMYEHRLLV